MVELQLLRKYQAINEDYAYLYQWIFPVQVL